MSNKGGDDLDGVNLVFTLIIVAILIAVIHGWFFNEDGESRIKLPKLHVPEISIPTLKKGEQK